MNCSLIFIHQLYSGAFNFIEDEEKVTTATDAYLELILRIGGDGFAAIVAEYVCAIRT